MSVLSDTVGANLRTRRKAFGISQEKLAQLASVTFGTINEIENGKRLPREPTLNKLAAALGCRPEDFFA